uniref:hypothetical protein n=1 Tax=Nocardioides stalactiti TaxID=2755356 RepID=UPI001600C198
FRFVIPKAAFPEWGSRRFLGAAGADANHGNQSFTVVAYCLPAALASGMSVQQVSFNPPGGALGQGPAGGAASCPSGHRVVGGGARLWDYATVGTGLLFSNAPLQTGTGWYATANLNTSSVLVEAMCLPTGSVPTLSLATRQVDNDVGSYAFFVGSPSVHCPPMTRVLTGGAHTALDGQFPNPADPHQGRVAFAQSEVGYVYATVGMNDGYESTTIVWCIPDLDPPRVSMTAPLATPLTARVALTAAITVGWTGEDDADHVERSQVRWRGAPYNGTLGAWEYPPSWQDLTNFSVTQGSRALGTTYCYSVRGRDPAGNWSLWTAQRCAVRPLDDAALTAPAAWTRATGGAYWNGTATTTSQQNATLTRTGARFNQLGLVVTKCPACGRVEVALDGVRIGIVNLYAATTAHRQLVAMPRTVGRIGTVTIKVLTAGKPVTIDGLVVSAS